MTRSPKIRYLIAFITIVIVLTGCELRRDDTQGEDVQDLSAPTLAPLGADSSEIIESGPPTVIIGDATATQSALEEETTENIQDQTVPTSQPAVDLSTETATDEDPAEQTIIEDESFDEVVSAEELTDQELETTDEQDTILEDEQVIINDAQEAIDPAADDMIDDYDTTADNDTHIVQPGDTLFSIGQRYGITVDTLKTANGLSSDVIYEGQILNITSAHNEQQGTHVVVAGETIFNLALQYGVSVEALAEANGLAYPYTIYPGQVLNIVAGSNRPGAMQPSNQDNLASHIVAPGETLFSIAQQYGLTVESIIAVNGLIDPNQLFVGQTLYLP